VIWAPVESKMLSAVAYSAQWHQPYLMYHSGDVYCYRGVPAKQYEELLAADSKGRYVRQHILSRYPYQRIHVAIRTAS
jgi:hypothetical protein